jgi:hypothetical protein
MKMKNIFKIVLFLLGCIPTFINAQTVEKNTLVLGLKYFNDNNASQHLVIQAKSKIDGKFQKIAHIPLKVYIANDADKTNLIGAGTTSERGELVVLIPPSAKAAWVKSASQTFVAVSAATKLYEEAKVEAMITKAKLKIDTSDGKIVNAKLYVLTDSIWKPMAGVEMVLTVKRLGGNLNINETATYTTDTAGAVTAEFKRENLPGDTKGNLILVANVIDNDTYGNLTAETKAPWGTKLIYTTNYNHRSLFARRGYSPIWLELLAYGIIAAVWIVIIYLILQIRKIIKLGLV